MAQKKFIIDGGFQTSDDSIIAANLEMTGHILPTVDSDGSTGFDLGSTTKKWRDLYLSEGSLYIDGQKVIESNSGTIVVQADPNQSLTTQVSGTGVLTLTSATSVNINGTLQMAAGKKITDVGGNAVTFGDKVDMDSNKIENVGTPTAATDGANKSYVDSTVSDLVNGAPGALDTLNELANALGDDEDFAATMTTSLGLKAATTYVDSADAAVTLAFQNADSASAATINAAWLAADNAQTTSINAAWAAADTAQTTAITTAYQTYADQAEADAESAAAADATSKADAALVSAKAYADQAEADAISTAAADATSKANAAESNAASDATSKADTALLDAKSYADTAEADAISTAAADATSKANAAQAAAATDATTKADAALVSAKAYTDTEVSNLVDSAPGAIDTLNELAAALGDDANFSTTMTTNLATKAAITYVDSQDAATLSSAQTYADTAEADAISTASGDATAKANAAQAAAATDATAKADAAQAAAIAAAATDATTKADAEHTYIDAREVAITTAYRTYADVAEADAISTASADATSKANAAQSAAEATAAAALSTAVANIESNISMTRFHSGVTDVSSASTVAYTFSDLVGAEDYAVYVNRMIVRPGELASVNLSTGVVTFNASIIEVDDEIEVAGWKFS
jgi:hypothetical protein